MKKNMDKEKLVEVEDLLDNEDFDAAHERLLAITDSNLNKETCYLAGYIMGRGMQFRMDTLKKVPINFDVTKLKLSAPDNNTLPDDLSDLIIGFLHGAIQKFEQATVPMSKSPIISA